MGSIVMNLNLKYGQYPKDGTYQVYGLICPDTNKIAYVGMSINSNGRIWAHLMRKERATYDLMHTKEGERRSVPTKIIAWGLSKEGAKVLEKQLILEWKKDGECWLNTYYGTTPNTVKTKKELARWQKDMAKTRKTQCQSGKERERLLSYNEKRKIKLIDQNGVIYESKRDCERRTGCHRVSIQAVLSVKFKQTNGYVFEVYNG
jgi:hypothetical protein